MYWCARIGSPISFRRIKVAVKSEWRWAVTHTISHRKISLPPGPAKKSLEDLQQGTSSWIVKVFTPFSGRSGVLKRLWHPMVCAKSAQVRGQLGAAIQGAFQADCAGLVKLWFVACSKSLKIWKQFRGILDSLGSGHANWLGLPLKRSM